MKKDNINALIVNEFLGKFSNQTKGTIGVEIELPIVSKNIIEMKNIQELFKYLIEKYEFIEEFKDNTNQIIGIIHKKNKDKISLEYSVNTLEFSLKEDVNIYNIKRRLYEYITIIQTFLQKFHYKLIGMGINPNYKKISRKCLKEDRYLIIEKLLTENNKNDMLFNEFCSYICSIQTHLTPGINEIAKVMNVFSKLEWVKSYLYANSYMDELKSNLARDHLWEISNFGLSNTGTNVHYETIEDIINNYKNRMMHFIQRNKNYYIIEPTTIEEYFTKREIMGRDYNNNLKNIKPINSDIQYFRSYKNIEITRRGTLEIRSDCTQKIDNLFEIVAFNVGVFEKIKDIDELIKQYQFEGNYISKRKIININSNINQKEIEFIYDVIDLVYFGLKERGKNEEILLKKVNEMRLKNEKSRTLVL